MGNVFTSPEIYLEETPMAKIIRPALKVFTHGILPVLPFNPKPRGHVDYKNHINSTDWNIKRNIADMKNTGLHAHFYSLGQSLAPDKKYDLEKINVPTLIMHGEKDTMIPMKNSINMSKEIKNSTFVSIPNVDHNTVHNGVKIISEEIESFIEKNLLYGLPYNNGTRTSDK
jgi:pimeloyl-ACP methyl ester carboxylesterase